MLIPALPRQVPLYSSPLRRCSELAAQLATALQAGEVIHDARLSEMDFGTWEMQEWSSIARAEVDAWAADVCLFRPGGGENVLGMAERVHAFLDALLQQGHDSAIVVCHGGTIRLLNAFLQYPSLMEAAHAAARIPHAIAYGELVVREWA
jgi:alpha-ribazole phosphatase